MWGEPEVQESASSIEIDNAGEWHPPECVVLQGSVRKAVLFQIPPIRLIWAVMQAEISTQQKLNALAVTWSGIVMILLAKYLCTEMLFLLTAYH